MKTIIGIGSHVDEARGYVTGLAMMHEMTLAILEDSGYKIEKVSLNSKFRDIGTVIAKASLKRHIDYLCIFLRFFFKLAMNRKAIVYTNPSMTKAGLKRDTYVVNLTIFFGHKIVFQQFGAMFDSFYKSLSEKEKDLLVKTYNKVDVIIVEGKYAKDQYKFIKDQSKIHVVNNGLPESGNVIVKTPKAYHKGDVFELFFMNNMIESKGYIDVLKAVNILVNERNLKIRCTFAGKFMSLPDDIYFKSTTEAQVWFTDYVRSNNLSECVSYHNGIFGQEKSSIFLRSNAFLLPSYYIFEGQPTAILEALSYGCVPVVTKYRLIPEMVTEKCGVFVDARSPESIADAIEKLYNDNSYYIKLSEGALLRFNKYFTREQYRKKIISVLHELNQ